MHAEIILHDSPKTNEKNEILIPEESRELSSAFKIYSNFICS